MRPMLRFLEYLGRANLAGKGISVNLSRKPCVRKLGQYKLEESIFAPPYRHDRASQTFGDEVPCEKPADLGDKVTK